MKFSTKYGGEEKIWEKLFRTGYLWREYDTKELQEYMLILKLPKITTRAVNKFIEESEQYENNSIHN